MRNTHTLICCCLAASWLLGSCQSKTQAPAEKKQVDAGTQAAPAPLPEQGKPVLQQKKNPWADLKPVVIGKHEGAATHVAFSKDGGWLLSTGKDRQIKLWNVSTGGLVRSFQGHTGDVLMADFSPDGTLIVSASSDETARIWESATGKCKQVLKKKMPLKMTEEEKAALEQLPPPQVNWATFSADGKQAITANDDFALRSWDVASGKLLLSFQDDGCRQRSVYPRRDGAGWLSAAGCMSDGVTYLKFWDEKGNLSNVQGDENRDAHYLAFDRAGQFIVTGDGSMSFSVYSAQGSFLKRYIVGTYHFCLAFGPDDKTLLIGTDGGEIFVFGSQTWVREGKIDVGERVALDSMAVSPSDGSLAVALRSGKVVRFPIPIRMPN
jgi:WD40 repeat protein